MTSPRSGTSSRASSADPHYEEELHTDTGGRPIYDDRFNLQSRRPIEAERTDR